MSIGTDLSIGGLIVAFVGLPAVYIAVYYNVMTHMERRHRVREIIAIVIAVIVVTLLTILIAIYELDSPEVTISPSENPKPAPSPPPSAPAPEVIKPTQPETRLPDRRRDVFDEPSKPAASNPPQSGFAQKPTCEAAIDKTEIPVSISVTGPSEISSEDVERSLEAQVPLPFRTVSQPECSALNITALITLSIEPISVNARKGHHLSATTDLTFLLPNTRQEKRVSSTYSDDFIDQDYLDSSRWPMECVTAQSIHKALLGFDSIDFLSSTFRVKITGLAPAEDSKSRCAAR